MIVDTSPDHVKAEIDRIKLVSQMGSNPKALNKVAQAYSKGQSRIHMVQPDNYCVFRFKLIYGNFAIAFTEQVFL